MTRRLIRGGLLALSTLSIWGSASYAQEIIYRCEKGSIVSYTNVEEEAEGNCRRVAMAKKPKPTKQSKTTADVVAEKTFPKIPKTAQKKLDEGRDSIIRKELAEQKKTLAEINDKLSHFEIRADEDQQKQVERFKALNDERRAREKAIENLEKQLGGKASDN